MKRILIPTSGAIALVLGVVIWGYTGQPGSAGSTDNAPTTAAVAAAPETAFTGSRPESGEPPALRANAAADPAELQARPGGLQSTTIPAEVRENLMMGVTGNRAAILADFVITPDEYEQAGIAAHTCTVEGMAQVPGVEVEPWRWEENHIRFGFSGAANSSHADASAVYDRCFDSEFRAVASGWTLEAAYSRMRPGWAAIAECMNARGVSVPANATWIQLKAASDGAGQPYLWQECSPKS